MRKGMAMGPVIGLALAIIAGLAIFAMQPSAKAKLGLGEDSLDKAGEQLLDFGCTNINDKGAGDSDKKSASFQEFMDAMKEVYTKCNAAGSLCSGTDVCRSMTLKLPEGSGAYYKINHTALKSWGFDMFNNYYVDFLGFALEGGANIYCKRENADTSDYEIDAYYSGGSYREDTVALIGNVWRILSGNKNICIEAYSHDIKDYDGSYDYPLFSVADGSKVTIKATKDIGTYGTAVDLKISVNGGKFEKKISAPLTPCTSKSDCKGTGTVPVPWAECTAGQCNYHYCQPGAKCKEIPVTCSMGTPPAIDANCVGTREFACGISPEYFSSAANGYKVRIDRLEKESDGSEVLFVYVSNSAGYATSGWSPVKKNAEVWYKQSSGKITTTDATDADAKASVAVKDIVKINTPTDPNYGKYIVSLLQGCY